MVPRGGYARASSYPLEVQYEGRLPGVEAQARIARPGGLWAEGVCAVGTPFRHRRQRPHRSHDRAAAHARATLTPAPTPARRCVTRPNPTFCIPPPPPDLDSATSSRRKRRPRRPGCHRPQGSCDARIAAAS
jgi:hypothetical protein